MSFISKHIYYQDMTIMELTEEINKQDRTIVSLTILIAILILIILFILVI